ncbi:PilW family protein [Terasakiispira papahanaumokuakeensis]|nr:hypothetical protein [Terasakiispira papahanaumokuakeensis]
MRRLRHSGFSLISMLLGLAISSLLVLALVQSWQLVGRGVQIQQVRQQVHDNVQLAAWLIREDLKQASTIVWAQTRSAGGLQEAEPGIAASAIRPQAGEDWLSLAIPVLSLGPSVSVAQLNQRHYWPQGADGLRFQPPVKPVRSAWYLRRDSQRRLTLYQKLSCTRPDECHWSLPTRPQVAGIRHLEFQYQTKGSALWQTAESLNWQTGTRVRAVRFAVTACAKGASTAFPAGHQELLMRQVEVEAGHYCETIRQTVNLAGGPSLD